LNVNVLRPELTEDVDNLVVCFGRFRPTRESSLVFARGGIVQNVRKRPGDKVAEGDVLADLDQQQIIKQKETIEAKLQRVRDEAKGVPRAQATQLAPQIKELESQLSELQAELANGQIKAPFPGIIAECIVEIGSAVSPRSPAFVIMEDKSPLVELNLNTEIAEQLDSNQRLWVGHNGTALITTIQQRSPILGPTGGLKLLLEFEKPLESDQWLYDKVVEIRFRIPSDASGYWLPLSALHKTIDGPWSILLAEKASEDGASRFSVARRDCNVIRHQDERVLVMASDLDDALVIADGSHRIVPGQSVIPVEVSSTFASPFSPAGAE